MFFDEGDPDAGGKTFAGHLAFGVKKENTYIWTNWTPQEVGETTLHVCLMEHHQDTNWGNATDSITVAVVDGGDGNDACLISTVGKGHVFPMDAFLLALFLLALFVGVVLVLKRGSRQA